MEGTLWGIAAAALAVLAWGVLEHRRLRLALERELRRKQGAEGWELLRLRRDGEQLARRVRTLEQARRETSSLRRKEVAEAAGEGGERTRAAMLEGFDNLMSYTEKTARGWAE